MSLKPKTTNIIASVLFCVVVFVPLILGLVQTDETVSSAEKRTLATLPPVPKTMSDIQNFPDGIATYYADHFGLREPLVKRYKSLKYAIGDSTSDDLTIGKDGWLFLGNIREDYKKFEDPFGDVRNKNIYTQEALEAFANNISGVNSWLARQGVEYLFIIAPNKHTIYFDKLPDYIQKINEQSATDQLIEHLKANTDVNILDLRPVLKRSKEAKNIYYKTDTHWNHEGANIAQFEIMQQIEKLFPGKIKAELKSMTQGKPYVGDLGNMLGVNIVKDDNPRPNFANSCALTHEPVGYNMREPHSWNCAGLDLNAVIFRDSFFSALEPYFSRSFGRSTFIWERVSSEKLRDYLVAENPDIIIEEWVERILPKQYPVSFMDESDQVKFDQSTEVLYRLTDGNLTFHQMDEMEGVSDQLRLQATGSDPIVYFPPLSMKAGEKYIMRLKIHSTIKSHLFVFYSEKDMPGFPFSQRNSVQIDIEKGDNVVYVAFEHHNIGQLLRLDPISALGDVKIDGLEIRQLSSTARTPK